jgi:acyl-CoA hydrolase
MISDGVLALLSAGALDEHRLLQASFIFGSEELYRWADGNPSLRMTRTEIINDPARIAANPAMFSLNTALEVDLYAQANATYVHRRVYSGFGGQPDFVVGALHSVGGHALVALRSWHAATDTSTIVPVLPRPVTSLQHSAIITDQGSAEIFGHSQPAQARLIIDNCAHPRARDGLREAAARLGLNQYTSAPT